MDNKNVAWILLDKGGLEVLEETDKAIFVLTYYIEKWLDGRQMWMPKSVIENVLIISDDDDRIILSGNISQWFMTKLRNEYT